MVRPMFEYASVSASAYDVNSLVGKLNEKAADGWEVVSIVPTGGDVTAFLKRSAASGNGESAEAVEDAEDTGGEPRHAGDVPAGDVQPVTPISEPAGWASEPGTTATEEPAAAESDWSPAAAGAAAAAGTGAASEWAPTSTTATEEPAASTPEPRAGGRRPGGGRPGGGRSRGAGLGPDHAGRVVPRSVRSLRDALLGRRHVDRARVAPRARRSPTRRWRDTGRPCRSDSIEDVRATSPATPASSSTRRRVDPLRPVVRAGLLRVLVRVPAQRPARRRVDGPHRAARLPLRLASARRPPRRGLPRRARRSRPSPCCSPASRPTSSSASSAHSASTEFIRTDDGEARRLGGLRRHPRRDLHHRRPGGDSALVVVDGTGRLVNQNDCRTRRPRRAVAPHGPVDPHWLQYSGAIWYPMVYDDARRRKRELADAKVTSAVRPGHALRRGRRRQSGGAVSAGPPAFSIPSSSAST